VGQRGNEFHDSISSHMERGERVHAFAHALVKVEGTRFDECEVVLTDRRLLVLDHREGGASYQVQPLPRDKCSVKSTREQSDGSLLVLVDHGDGVLCLAFNSGWGAEAADFLKELRKSKPRSSGT